MKYLRLNAFIMSMLGSVGCCHHVTVSGECDWNLVENENAFCFFLICTWFVTHHMIWLNREEKRHVKVPQNIEDAKKLGAVLSRYKEQYYHQVLIAYFTSYVLYPFVYSVNFRVFAYRITLFFL